MNAVKEEAFTVSYLVKRLVTGKSVQTTSANLID